MESAFVVYEYAPGASYAVGVSKTEAGAKKMIKRFTDNNLLVDSAYADQLDYGYEVFALEE